MADLERQLKIVDKEAKRKGGPLKRKFIVSEGIFENNGAMVDLAKIVSQCRAEHSSLSFILTLDAYRSSSRKSTSSD
jgi:7-keto-8-aminopelargonate synthetase-like enzyme